MSTPALSLTFATAPDLDATMDIQIPALAWQPAGAGRWERTYYHRGRPTPVRLEREHDTLRFFFHAAAEAMTAVRGALAAAFGEGRQIADLALDSHPVLNAMRRHFGGVITMTAPVFEALVLTVLSQNRTGDTVRRVFPRLAAACGGITARRVAALPVTQLAELIRPAGPYKAARLAETASIIATVGEAAFERIVRRPGPQALTYLEALPGVAHKTAACVLVFAAATTATLPVDTHLFRVVDRLGLASHGGRSTRGVRDQIITTLLGHGPDLAPAHFLFLLLGRSTCVAGTPNCRDCFLSTLCQHATTHPPEAPQ